MRSVSGRSVGGSVCDSSAVLLPRTVCEGVIDMSGVLLVLIVRPFCDLSGCHAYAHRKCNRSHADSDQASYVEVRRLRVVTGTAAVMKLVYDRVSRTSGD